MNIRMAAVAACALTLGITPAAADLFTFESTVTATPGVVQVGEKVVLRVSIALIATTAPLSEPFVLGIAVPGQLTIYDDFSVLFGGGPPHSRDFIFAIGTTYPGSVPNFTEFDFTVSYDTPGFYSPFFQAVGEMSIRPIGGGIQHVGYRVSGGTSISVIPGPVIGAGLPGLVLAFGSGLAWWRRRYPKRIQSVPLNHTLMC